MAGETREPGKLVVLLGPPGCGKGTQAKKLVQEFGLTHISVGDLLREEVRKGSDLGRQVKKVMEVGELVSDELVSEIVRSRLTGENGAGRFVLDGYPRNIAQAEYLASVADQMQVRVVNIKVDQAQVVRRLSGRRFCPECGRIYNIYFSPPVVPMVCDGCGSKLVHRSDDKEEVIRERLRVYDEQTRPLVDFYSSAGNYHEVDGNWEPEDVFDELAKVVRRMWG